MAVAIFSTMANPSDSYTAIGIWGTESQEGDDQN